MARSTQRKRMNNQTPLLFGKWLDCKRQTPLHSKQVYQLLDELVVKGYTALQILEIIELGIEQYENK